MRKLKESRQELNSQVLEQALSMKLLKEQVANLEDNVAREKQQAIAP